VVDPITAQLTQGLTPERLALTVALGVAAGLFPVLGTTRLVCLALGTALRLNQPALQAVNYACTPLQLPFIFFALHTGHRVFGQGEISLNPATMLHEFWADPLQFTQAYGRLALQGIVVWAALAVPLVAMTYRLTLPALRRAATLLPRSTP
jgi:uncharacterized protein (DUF2062 family)